MSIAYPLPPPMGTRVPVAAPSPAPALAGSAPASAAASPLLVPLSSRRPSPWHELAHSLSTASLPPATPPTPSTRDAPPSPPAAGGPGPAPTLSTSLALREWDAALTRPDSDVRRHQLVHVATTPPAAAAACASPVSASGSGSAARRPPAARHASSPPLPVPKLAAERDRDGHIEYKLKLIEPAPDRLERLVSQMLWRLKQGRNEAIYELGLADDGTVVGLTRAEMDASLRTLERMASEVGATVIVLKEIVLAAAPARARRAESETDQDTPPSSSAVSLASLPRSAPRSAADSPPPSPAPWPVRRPDLDAFGRPRRGTHTLVDSVSELELGGGLKRRNKGRRERERERERQAALDAAPLAPPPAGPRPHRERDIIFSPFGSDDDDSSSPAPSTPTSDLDKAAPRSRAVSGASDDCAFGRGAQHACQPAQPAHFSAPMPVPVRSERKATARRLRSAARRERRRLDLLRGDGTGPAGAAAGAPFADPPSESIVAESIARAPSAPGQMPAAPYQPSRPSSLRLAEPAAAAPSVAAAPNGARDGVADDSHEANEEPAGLGQGSGSFLDSLLHVPLDSLSLSFADVRTVPDQRPVRGRDSDDGGEDDDDDDADLFGSAPSPLCAPATPAWAPEEMICVEALVVRKVQHGMGANAADGAGAGGGDDDDDDWAFGGDDDGWGLGGDD